MPRAWLLLLLQAMAMALPVTTLWPLDLVAAPVISMLSAAVAIGGIVPVLHVRFLCNHQPTVGSHAVCSFSFLVSSRSVLLSSAQQKCDVCVLAVRLLGCMTRRATQVTMLGMPREHGRALGAVDMVWRVAGGFWRGAFCFHLVAVAMGAPLLSRCGHTLAWAILMASCTAVPACCRWGYPNPSYSDGAGWSRCFVYIRPLTCLEDLAVAIPSYGALLGAWVGGCAGPLDWEVPWQVWPIASGYGTCGGAAAGSLVAGLGAALFAFQ